MSIGWIVVNNSETAECIELHPTPLHSTLSILSYSFPSPFAPPSIFPPLHTAPQHFSALPAPPISHHLPLSPAYLPPQVEVGEDTVKVSHRKWEQTQASQTIHVVSDPRAYHPLAYADLIGVYLTSNGGEYRCGCNLGSGLRRN